MGLDRELLKEQLSFRTELKERVYWFIKLRWIAFAVALAGAGAAYFFELPVPFVPLLIILFFIFVYNFIFLLIWHQLESLDPAITKPFETFAHTQISLDLIALFLAMYFTGGIYSPLLWFVIFHVILAGILLSPASCFIYGGGVIAILGALLALTYTPLPPVLADLIRAPLFPYHTESSRILTLYTTLTGSILISAFLITSVNLSLRTKVRELIRVSQELDASNAKLTSLYEIVKEMGLYANMQQLLDSAARQAAQVMGVKACSIKLLDENKKTLRFVSAFGLSEDYIATKASVNIEKSPINRKIIEGSVHAIGKIDEKDYFQYPEDIQKEGISSMLCLPLRVENVIFGVFCVYSAESNYFQENDVAFFSLMSDLTALAIENLRSDLNKSWFLKKAAHELRAPFNTVYSMLKMIRQGYLGPINEKQEETITRCERRIELLGHLIDDLLKLGIKRSQSGKVDMHPVDCGRMVSRIVGLFQSQAEAKNIGIECFIENNVPLIHGEEKLLDEVFTNLISNAIKYTPPDGKVLVTLAPHDAGCVRFEIADTGIGIPEEDLPRLFGEFFRADNAKEFSEDGTGLGLVIVKEILDRLDGTITVKSTVGEGTTFTCLLRTTG